MFRDQAKLLEDLKRHERTMTPADISAYKLFVQRNKDEDEFDSVSMKRLNEMHARYVKYRSKTDFENLFKKPEENGST